MPTFDGAHEVTLRRGGTDEAFELPYQALSDDPTKLVVEVEDFEVTNQADAMTQLLAWDALACFAAFRNDAFIAGLVWTYTVDGVPAMPSSFLGPNCYVNPTTIVCRWQVDDRHGAGRARGADDRADRRAATDARATCGATVVTCCAGSPSHSSPDAADSGSTVETGS